MIVGDRLAEAGGRERDPGQRRAEVALDVVGQRLERGDVEDADGAGLSRGWRAGAGSRPSRSRHQRKAARVLPLPVGAWISVWWPVAIAAQPSAWAWVGRLERRLEPVPDGGAERRERIGGRARQWPRVPSVPRSSVRP